MEQVHKYYRFVFWNDSSEGCVLFCTVPSLKSEVMGQVRLWLVSTFIFYALQK